MEGLRDQLLARAGLTADEHRRVRPRDLRDGLVHALHRAAVADDVREVVALAQLLLEPRVLGDEPLVLRGHEPLHLDRLSDERRDDAEELRGPVVVAVRQVLDRHAQRAHRLAVDRDRHAEEAVLLGAVVLPAEDLLHETGLGGHARHDDELAGLDDTADDRTAVERGGLRRPAGAGDGLDRGLARVLVDEDERAPDGVVVPAEGLEDVLEGRPEVERARERLADLQQTRELLDFAGSAFLETVLQGFQRRRSWN